jgi:hypothetical protein
VVQLAASSDGGLHVQFDGATQTIRKLPRMDPLAKKGGPKFNMEGKKTLYFGYLTYIAWNNVFCPVLSKSLGNILTVLGEDDVDALLDAEVMM